MTTTSQMKDQDLIVEDLDQSEDISTCDALKPGKMSKCMEAALEAVEKMGDKNKH